MKTKISFTSVLKSKASVNSRMISNSSSSSQHSIIDSQLPRQQQHQHQNHHNQLLIDIYQQYESYPEQDYTLDFGAMTRNGLGYSNGRSRNSSMNNNMMLRSKNVVSEDPEMSLEMWVEKQKMGGNNEVMGMGMRPQQQKSFK